MASSKLVSSRIKRFVRGVSRAPVLLVDLAIDRLVDWVYQR